jgi:hypothetical protein
MSVGQAPGWKSTMLQHEIAVMKACGFKCHVPMMTAHPCLWNTLLVQSLQDPKHSLMINRAPG